MGLIEQKMHHVYKIPLYRESDLNRLRWLGGLAIILGAILRSSGFPEEFDFAVTIIGITCFMVVSYFEKDNDASSGSKGDYIFKDSDADGNEIVSIMFEMKNEKKTMENTSA